MARDGQQEHVRPAAASVCGTVISCAYAPHLAGEGDVKLGRKERAGADARDGGALKDGVQGRHRDDGGDGRNRGRKGSSHAHLGRIKLTDTDSTTRAR